MKNEKNKKTKAAENRIYSKEDLKHSGIARHCECMRITPKVLSELTGIPQQRIEDAVSAKVSLDSLEVEKISVALGCRRDALYDDRLDALDERLTVLGEELHQMQSAYERAFDDASDKIAKDPEIANIAMDGIDVDAIENSDCTAMLFVLHSLVSEIKREDDLEGYFVSNLLKMFVECQQDEDLDQGILVVDERDFDVAISAIKVAFLLAAVGGDSPKADVSVYVFNADKNRFTQEVIVLHGAEGRSREDPNAETILNAHTKAFRETLERVYEMPELLPALFEDDEDE